MNKKLNDATKHIKMQGQSLDFGGRAIINAKLINCEGAGGGGSDPNAVKYTEQNLTDLQKAQARTNIGAGSAADVSANAAAIAAETSRAVAAEGTLQEMISAIDRGEGIVAWDGASTPVVAEIPAGVTVTYNDVTYTGTLAASSDTKGPVYYVADGNGNATRYMVSQSGSTYSWLAIGTTEIDLSQYATKAELNQLDQEIAPIADAVADLGWTPETHKDFVFNGTSSKAILKDPIVLSQNGDSIEIEVETQITGAVSGTGGYNFSQGGPTNATAWCGIGVTNNRTQIRADDQTWIPDSNPRAISGTFKWSWENGNIVLYRGSAGADVTYTGQKTVTIRQFGYSDHNSEVNKYWAGTIKKLKVNGVDYDLATKATLTDVTYTTVSGNQSFLTDKEKAGLNKPVKVVSRTVGTESQVSVYVPQTSGYVEYLLARRVDAGKNLDAWVVVFAYKTDDAFSRGTQITVGGNWECAIKIKGRTDNMGGPMHGDEIMKSVLFVADGVVKGLSDLAAGVECETFHIISDAYLYDPDDGTTNVADHSCDYEFSMDGLRLRQAINWKAAETLAESYLAMLPIAQAVTDHYCLDRDFAPQTIPSGGMSNIARTNVSLCYIWGESAGIFATFAIGEYPSIVSPRRFLGTNNGGTSYNKLYYYTTLPNQDTTVASGDIWKTETIYKITA